MTYHSTSIFLDILYRYTKLDKNNKILDPIALQNYEKKINKLYSDDTINASLGSSSRLRFNIMELIALSQGYKLKQMDYPEETKEISIACTPIAREEQYWIMQYYIGRMAEKIDYSIRTIKDKLHNKKENYTIGYIYIQKEYFNQLSNINFKKIDKDMLNLKQNVSLLDRKLFCNEILPTFYQKLKNMNKWKLFSEVKLNEELIKVLCSFISLKLESSIIKRDCLSRILKNNMDYLKDSEFDALFSIGNWFRIENALIAISARRLKIPIIEFQSGGGTMYLTRTGLTREMKKTVDYYFSWGDWQTFTLKGDRDTIKVPDARLLKLNARREKSVSIKNKIKSIYRVLHIPVGFSDPYIMEMYNHYDENLLMDHRLKFATIFYNLDRSDLACKTKLYVKIKAFNKIYENYEHMLIPDLQLNNIDVSYLLKGLSNQYFNYMDICLIDGMSTTFAECMATNIPTICYWNTEMIKIKPIYQKLVSDLIELGIIITNKDQMYSSLNRLYNDPEWWYRSTVQECRKVFIDLYAYYSTNWIAELNTSFMLVLNAMK